MKWFDRVTAVSLGREAAVSETNRAVRELVAAAQRAQNIRRLERGRRACRAGRHRDLLDRHDQRFALDEIEARVEIVRDAMRHAAVDIDLLDLRKAGQQLVAEPADSLV